MGPSLWETCPGSGSSSRLSRIAATNHCSGGLLTLAVNHRQPARAELLLDLGADVDERILLEELEEPTESWGTPLWYAAFAGDLAMTRMLLDRGADPNANVYASGWPLRNAWGHPDDPVKKLLLERGAKKQPYMVAATHDIEEARRLLKKHPTRSWRVNWLGLRRAMDARRSSNWPFLISIGPPMILAGTGSSSSQSAVRERTPRRTKVISTAWRHCSSTGWIPTSHASIRRRFTTQPRAIVDSQEKTGHGLPRC